MISTDDVEVTPAVASRIYNKFNAFRVDEGSVCELGEGVNLFKGQTTPMQVIQNPNKFIRNHKTWVSDAGHTESYTEFIENTRSSLDRIAGSVNFGTNLKWALKLSLKARFERVVTEETKTISVVFVSRTKYGYHKLDLGNLTPEKLMVQGDNTPTHICTAVHRGSSLIGTMKLTKRETCSDNRAKMKTVIQGIPYSEDAEKRVQYDKAKFAKDYIFYAEFKSTTSSKKFDPVTDIDGFFKTLNEYYSSQPTESALIDSDDRNPPNDSDIIQYEFTPILAHKNFGSVFPGLRLADKFYEEYFEALVNMELTDGLAEELLERVNEFLEPEYEEALNLHRPNIDRLSNVLIYGARTKTAKEVRDAFCTGQGEGKKLSDDVQTMKKLNLASLSTHHEEIHTSRLFLSRFLKNPALALPRGPDNVDGWYTIKSHHGTYLRIKGDYSSWTWYREVDAVRGSGNTPPSDPRCHFFIKKDTRNMKWTLKADGLYLSARYRAPIGKGYIDARRNKHSTESFFQLFKNENGTFSFRGHYDKWIRCHSNGEVDDVPHRNSHEMFICERYT